jgi:multiple sugar transport system permease protein
MSDKAATDMRGDASPGPAGKAGSWANLGLSCLLVGPGVAVMAGMVLFPLVMTLWSSLHRVNPMQAKSPFVGLAEYRAVLANPDINTAWVNIVWIVVIAVALQTVFGIAVALLLNGIGKARKWLLAAVVLPWAMPPVVNALIWTWIYHPSYGLLNDLLLRLGVIDHYHVWFNDRGTGLFLVAVVQSWRMMPLTAILVLAALQSIPDELYEAADLDGASRFRSFWAITLPLIWPVVAIAMTQSIVYAFNLFDEAWLLGGANLDTRTPLIQVYLLAFQNLQFSRGMALSVLVMIATVAASLIFIARIRRETGLDS